MLLIGVSQLVSLFFSAHFDMLCCMVTMKTVFVRGPPLDSKGGGAGVFLK